VKTAENAYPPNEFRFCPLVKAQAASGDFPPPMGNCALPEGRKFI